MNKTISMTDILLAVPVGRSLWFLLLLLYERIMETWFARFFKDITRLRRSLGRDGPKGVAVHEEVSTIKVDIINKSRFKMAFARTIAAISAQETTTSEKGIELSEEEATFDDGNTETMSHPAQILEEKLGETSMSISSEELRHRDNEPEEDVSDTSRASDGSFDEVGDAYKTTRNPGVTQAECEKAAKTLTDTEGMELYEKMTGGSSEIGTRIKGLIRIQLRKSEKEFVVPDNIEDLDIHNYV